MIIHSGHEGKDRVCCNCRHNIRIPQKTYIECRCDIDGHYIGYVECFDCWCRHWAKDPWQEKGETMEEPKPSELRPIKDSPRIGEIRMPEYMQIDGKVKKIEWVLDVNNGILYPRERRTNEHSNLDNSNM